MQKGEQGIVIPAYEPDERLIKLLTELDQMDLGSVFIVNDGSGREYDHIFEKAENLVERLDGRVIRHDINRGKGRALKTAFEYILNNRSEIKAVVTADSDGQHTPECINKIITTVKSCENGFILGVRKFDGEGIPWKSRFGNNLTVKLFKYITGVYVSDTQTGLRGIPREYLRELIDLKGERFEYEMRMLLYVADHFKIEEVPIKTVYESESNHKTHFNAVKDSVRIYRILGERFFRFLFSSLSSCVLDLIFFWIFCRALKGAFPFIYTALATVAARIISAVYNYLINYKIVFASKSNIRTSAVKYVTLAVIQMGLSAALVTGIVNVFIGSSEVIIKVIVDTVLFFVSYKVQQKFVFKSRVDK